MRGFSALRGIRMIGITETTIEIIIKIIIMRDISHLSLTIIMNMVNGIINARKITTEVTNQGMKEEMIVIARQLITSKITEVKISECLPEVSK
jgi:non-homologous end joining protein Ku